MRYTVISQLVFNLQLKGGGDGGGYHCPYFKMEKSALILGTTYPNFVHTWIKSSIKNVVLGITRRKDPKIFPRGSFFLVFLLKSLSKCRNSTKLHLPWKIFGCTPAPCCKLYFKRESVLWTNCSGYNNLSILSLGGLMDCIFSFGFNCSFITDYSIFTLHIHH